MLRPTIYIPSQLTKLLIPRLTAPLDLAVGRRSNTRDRDRIERRDPADWRADNGRWSGSRSLYKGLAYPLLIDNEEGSFCRAIADRKQGEYEPKE